MRLSTRGRYGMRVLLELALNYGKGPISVKEISKNQGLSKGYVEHIIVALQKAGIVKTIRGKEGGCSLAREPAKISVAEALNVLEGPLSPVECIEDIRLCRRVKVCAVRDVWLGLKTTIENFLRSITLADLVKIHREKIGSEQALMYYI
jgi:Rrf2 family cysteine metabolism transcriptional repressor